MLIATIANHQQHVALVVLGSDATTRRTDEGHPHHQERAMQHPLTGEVKSALCVSGAEMRERFVDLEDRLRDQPHAAAAELNALRAAVHDTNNKIQEAVLVLHIQQHAPCQHPARALRYLGLCAWTGGPELVNGAECAPARGGCGWVGEIGADGDLRAFRRGATINFPSKLAG